MARRKKDTPQNGGLTKRLLRALRLGAVILLPLLALVVAYRVFTSPSGGVFAISRIEFEGLEKLDDTTLEKRIQESVTGNIFRVDLDEIRRQVESASWVKSAVVRRRLPNRLVISIEERRPTAVAQIGQEMILVDQDGVLLGRQDPGFPLPEGPVVVGLADPRAKDAQSRNSERMQMYLQVVEDLSRGEVDLAQTISEIDVSNLKRVAVVPTDEPVLVCLGDQEFRKRYEVFQAQRPLYNEYKKKHGRIDEVDVSFDRRIIFKTPSKSRNAVELKPPASGTD